MLPTCRKDAVEKNSKYYFTGEACKYGHVSPRHTKNSTCSECQKIRIKRWTQTNIGKVSENNRNSYFKRKSENKTYYQLNKEHAKQYRKEWVAKNRQKRNEISRRYVKQNPQARKLTSSTSSRNRRSKILQCKNSHTVHDVLQIYNSQSGRCAYCKKKVGTNYHVDHIVPISKGGGNGKENLQICCPSCNLRKNAKDPIDFAQELGLLI